MATESTDARGAIEETAPDSITNQTQQQEEIADATDFWIFGYGSLIWKPPPHYDERVPGWVEGYVRRFWQASQDHRGTPEAPGRVVTLIARNYYALLEDPDPEPSPEEIESHLSHVGSDSAGFAQAGRVWGAAYHIPKEHSREVLEYLDVREQNGYSLERAIFFPSPPNPNPRVPQNKPLLSDIHGSSQRAELHQLASAYSAHQETHDPFICLVYIGLPSNPQFTGPQDLEQLARHILKSKGPSGENKEYLFELEQALLSLSPELGSGDRHVADLARRSRRLQEEKDDKQPHDV